jgi:hypothetical protein
MAERLINVGIRTDTTRLYQRQHGCSGTVGQFTVVCTPAVGGYEQSAGEWPECCCQCWIAGSQLTWFVPLQDSDGEPVIHCRCNASAAIYQWLGVRGRRSESVTPTRIPAAAPAP